MFAAGQLTDCRRGPSRSVDNPSGYMLPGVAIRQATAVVTAAKVAMQPVGDPKQASIGTPQPPETPSEGVGMSVQQIGWDLALIQKYSYSGLRYTSRPIALGFLEDFGEQVFLQAVACHPGRPLSLYVHILFRHKLCYFCGCNKTVTCQQYKADQYLDALGQEIVHCTPLFAGRHVDQLHWGDGTPTYLSKMQISRLVKLLRENLQFDAGAEISIEVGLREIELDVLDHLCAEGSNQLNMGMQGFNKEAQHLVNREQNEEFTFAPFNHTREIGFTSTSIDLIYGLPKQTSRSFALTLKRVAELNPGRLSAFSYAHLPTAFVAQRKAKDASLSGPQQKLDILQETIAFLTQSGYQFIGMDYFARPNDELMVAQCEGVLYRNFQGYTTQGDIDLLGMDASTISTTGDRHARNQKELKQYYQ